MSDLREMSVALVTKPDRRMTGLLRYALSVYDALRERGVDISLCHPRPLPRGLARAGKALGLDAAAFGASYPMAVDVGRAQICHLASQTLATLLLAQRLPPTVVTVHDIIPHLVRRDKALSTQRHLFDWAFDRLALDALRRADALIAISEYTKRTLVESLRYPAERIHVVYRAVDAQVFRPLPVSPEFRRRHALEEGHAYVLYVGSEDPRKNVEGLIRAFALVRKEIPWARLVKAGAAHFDAERGRLTGLVQALGLQGEVCFLDHVSDEDLPLLYNAAQVLVLPSYYEGFGLPALEAMSCGTPVVASNRASLPEVVGDGGALVDPDDTTGMARAIAALLTDPGRREAAAQAALRQAGRFSLERQARETMAVYGGLE